MPTAIIPARGGSVEIPKKNIRKLGRKPLVVWSIEFALNMGFRTIINTDDSGIAEVCEGFECEVYERPEDVHQGHAINPVLDCIDFLSIAEDEPIFLMLPTAPFRREADYHQAIQKLEHSPAVIGVTLSKPLHSLRYMVGEELQPIIDCNVNSQRQDVAPLYEVTGSLFLSTTRSLFFNKTFHVPGAVAQVMPWSVDINSWDDLELARKLAG